MVMNALRQQASGGIGKFILFGFLVLAAGGLVFTDVGGFFRGGVGSNEVAKIGGEAIPATKFDRTLRRTISRLGITPEQAYKAGYTREILNSEIRGRLIDLAAKDYSIQIPESIIAEEVQNMLMPFVQGGQNSKDVFQQLLMQQGYSEAEFVNGIERDLSVSILQEAIKGGFVTTSDAFLSDLADFEKESRAIEYVAFLDKDFKDVESPTELQLQNLYEATKEAYATSETRVGKLITVNTADLEKTLDISEDDIRAEYDANIEGYSKPEMRSFEQVILYEAEDAQEVLKNMEAGQSLKEALKAVTGNVTDYIPAKLMAEGELLEELKEQVFAAQKGDRLGPIESALGQHIIVVKDIQAAKTQSYDSVKKEIKKDLIDIALTDARYELANTVDDLLAGGATPEDLKEEVDVEITTLPAVSRYGLSADGKPLLDKYKDKPQFLETLYELNEGEASATFEMDGAKMAALYLETINEKSYKPFTEIKDTLSKRWVEDQRRSANKQAAIDKFKSGADLKSLGTLKKLGGLTRASAPKKPLTPDSLNALFDTPVGESELIEIEGGVAIARVTANKVPENPYSKDERTKAQQAVIESAQNEGLTLFVEQQNKKHKAMINDRLLERIYNTQ